MHGSRLSTATLDDLRGNPSEHWRYAAAHANVVLDKTEGELTRVVAEQELLPAGGRDAVVREALDGYINQTYRSLRYGTRLDAVEAIPYALRTIFALENRVRPYNKYLEWELRHHSLEGWSADELLPLLDRVLTGEPEAQHELFRRIEEPARREGFGDVDRRLGARRRLAPRRGGLPRAVKKRLDVLLVERGLAESRAQAQALVLAGLVHGYDKPGQQVARTPSSKSRARRRTSRAEARSSRTGWTRSASIRPASTASTWAPRPAASPTSSCSAARHA